MKLKLTERKDFGSSIVLKGLILSLVLSAGLFWQGSYAAAGIDISATDTQVPEPKGNLPPKIHTLTAMPEIGKAGVESVFYFYAVDQDGDVLTYAVHLAGDFDGNGVIDQLDLERIRYVGEIAYDPELDVVPDGVINDLDVRYLRAHYGNKFPDGFGRKEQIETSYLSLTAVYSWTPGKDQTGHYDFMFKATDPAGLKDARILRYDVILDENALPYFVNLPDVVHGRIGEPASFEVEIRDPDKEDHVYLRGYVPFVLDPAGTWIGEFLRTELIKGPEVVLDPSGAFLYTSVMYRVTWQSPAVEGRQAGVLITSDGHEHAELITGRFIYDIAPAVINAPPVVRAPETVEGVAGREIRFDVQAGDSDGHVVDINAKGLPEGARFLIIEVVNTLSGTVETPVTMSGTFLWTPTQRVDGHQVTFCAVDDKGAETCSDTLITVIQPNQPPVMTYVRNTWNRTISWLGSDREDGSHLAYQYRVDGGNWSEKTTLTSIYIRQLQFNNKSKSHFFEVRAIDSKGAISQPMGTYFYNVSLQPANG